jgi:hypothetical protein
MSYQRYAFKDRTFQRYGGDQPRTGTVELYVDWDLLVMALGDKAAHNKNGKTGMALGIKAKFIPQEKK